jgi:DNA-binding Lrp family transcriptional regulator
MAVGAYVMIRTTPGTGYTVAKALKKIKGVSSVHSVTGPVDAIAMVEASDFKALGDLVVNKLQKIEGVRSTITCVIAE